LASVLGYDTLTQAIDASVSLEPKGSILEQLAG
jgi:hypothetical protein